MRPPLTIAVVQPRCVAHDVGANALAHAAAIQAADARVVVFPELSLTGYEMQAAALRPDDPRLTPIVDACAQTGSVALVGLPLAGDGDQAFIAVLAVDGLGASPAYRKVWLASEEAKRFAPGPGPAVLTVDGWRLGLAICRDTGIPAHAADTAALGIDGYVAGTLLAQAEVAVLGERARRVGAEHGAWVAVASFAGPTGEGYDHSAGCSGIWSADGAVLAQAGVEPGEIARATISDAAGSRGE
jgi:predicted amidohydrolase